MLVQRFIEEVVVVSDGFAIKITSKNSLKMKDWPPSKSGPQPWSKFGISFKRSWLIQSEKCKQISFLKIYRQQNSNLAELLNMGTRFLILGANVPPLMEADSLCFYQPPVGSFGAALMTSSQLVSGVYSARGRTGHRTWCSR